MDRAILRAEPASPTRRVPSAWFFGLVIFALLAVIAPRPAAGGDPPTDAAVTADLAAIERAFGQIAEQVAPAVVGIRARRKFSIQSPSGDSGVIEQMVIVNGSGAIIRSDGAILTNEHVVQDADEIEVLLHDGAALPATILAADKRSDLAIVRIARDRLPTIRFCDWSQVRRGQWALTLGNPYGIGSDGKLSVSVGVISNLDRRLPGLGDADDRLYADMIQVTAPIVPGNSGGPLLNLRGELVGVVTAMHTRTADDDGVGFAIPMAPSRRQIIDRLLSGEPVRHGYLGLSVRSATEQERVAAGIDTPIGARIENIESDGPARRSGLRTGDIVIRAGDREIRDAADLADMAGRTPVGTALSVVAIRGTERVSVSVTVAARSPDRAGALRNGAILWRGLRLADAERDPGVGLDRPVAAGVVVVEIAEHSPAIRTTLAVGDRIDRVENQTVDDVHAFRECVRTRQGQVELTVRGRGVVRIPPG